VVCLLAGMWPEFGPDGTDTAGAVNVLTSTVPTQPSRSSRTHSVAVQVRPVDAPAGDPALISGAQPSGYAQKQHHADHRHGDPQGHHDGAAGR